MALIDTVKKLTDALNRIADLAERLIRHTEETERGISLESLVNCFPNAFYSFSGAGVRPLKEVEQMNHPLYQEMLARHARLVERAGTGAPKAKYGAYVTFVIPPEGKTVRVAGVGETPQAAILDALDAYVPDSNSKEELDFNATAMRDIAVARRLIEAVTE